MNDRRCDKCGGRGSILRLIGREKQQTPCSRCGGSGWMPSPGDVLPPLPRKPWEEGANANLSKLRDKLPPGYENEGGTFKLPDLRPETPHFHRNKVGMLEACYHRCREINWRTLGLSMVLWTAGFPLEHLLWERAPLFSDLTHWLGL